MNHPVIPIAVQEVSRERKRQADAQAKLQQAGQMVEALQKQLQQMQQQLQQLQFENAQLKLENKNKEEKHEVDIYNAETQRIRALSDHEVDATTLNMNAIGKILDASKAVDELDIYSVKF